MICTPLPISRGRSSFILTKYFSGDKNVGGRDGRHEAYMDRTEMHSGFWQGNLKESDHLKI
jgi:hypothetical protein